MQTVYGPLLCQKSANVTSDPKDAQRLIQGYDIMWLFFGVLLSYNLQNVSSLTHC